MVKTLQLVFVCFFVLCETETARASATSIGARENGQAPRQFCAAANSEAPNAIVGCSAPLAEAPVGCTALTDALRGRGEREEALSHHTATSQSPLSRALTCELPGGIEI